MKDWALDALDSFDHMDPDAVVGALREAHSRGFVDGRGMKADLQIYYRNYEGEIRWRKVRPVGALTPFGCAWYGSTPHHPTMQWFFQCYDLERGEPSRETIRDFAVKDIISWRRPNGV